MHSELTFKGIYHDRLILQDGSVVDHDWRSNIIVNRCRELLAAFMLGDSVVGIQYLALGQGDPNWDSTPPAPPPAGTQQLTDVAPVQIALSDPSMTIAYLNSANAAVAGPTHRLQISVTLAPGTPSPPPGETSYPLREFALFGRYGSEDYMIDYVRHPVIHKGVNDTLVRTIRLVF